MPLRRPDSSSLSPFAMPERLELSEDIRGALLKGGAEGVKPDYSLVHLTAEQRGEHRVINLVPVAVHEDRLLVAVPESAWNRAVAKRLLPPKALSKPILIEVPLASWEEPDSIIEGEFGKVWVGYLDPKLANQLEPGRADAALADVWVEEDGTTFIPSVYGLLEALEDHFSFLSAGSDAGRLSEQRSVHGVAREVDVLQSRISGIESSLALLHDKLAATSPEAPRPSALRRPKAERDRAREEVPDGSSLLGLDPAVLSSARLAGVPEDQLRKLGEMLAKSTRMGDAPAPVRGVSKKKAFLSETEEEDEEDVAEAEVSRADPEVGGKAPQGVEQAVLQLTKIVKQLSSTKKPRDLQTMMDGVDGETGGGEGSSSSSSKSKSAVYKKLRRALQEDPAYVYGIIEEHLEEDFQIMRSAPGTASQNTSARAWLEHRSKLGHFPTTIRFSWILAGILDNLRSGSVKEARARAALALVATDQAALDSGNWLLAQEVLLEDPPPFASFQGRRVPEQWEQTNSKLLDDQWLEVLMWKIRNKDAYLESRKRLASSRPFRGPDPGISKLLVETASNIGGKDGKGKDGKGKGKSGKESKSPSETGKQEQA